MATDKYTSLLLEVEDTFDLSGIGLVVAPLLELPDDFRPQKLSVLLQTLDGAEKELIAQLTMPHFRYTSGESGFRLQIGFPGYSKDEVPVGSKILISTEAAKLFERRPNPSNTQ
ncbi:MAG: hypothetical protein AAFY57_17475 [Cyanobacteria bacterium J06642_2]